MEGRLRDAGRVLYAQAERTGDGAQADAEVRHLLGEVAALRASIASRRKDLPGAVELSRQALELLPEEDVNQRAFVIITTGFAHLSSGDALAAERAYLEAAKHGDMFRSAVGSWSYILLQRGRLRQAAEALHERFQRCEPDDLMRIGPMGASGLVLVARFSYEWNDLEAAIPPLQRVIQVAERWDAVWLLAMGYEELVRIYRVRGEVGRAREALGKLMQLVPRLTDVLWMGPAQARAAQARFWLVQGDLVAAARWAQGSGLNVDDEFNHSSVRLFEYLTLARVRIAEAWEGAGEANLDAVLRFLVQQGEQAETQGRMWDFIKTLVLQTLARQAQGDIEEALAALDRALTLAELEGYVRTFIDEGEPMAELLRLAATRGVAPGYVAKLLAAYGEEAAPSAPATTAAQPLIEP